MRKVPLFPIALIRIAIGIVLLKIGISELASGQIEVTADRIGLLYQDPFFSLNAYPKALSSLIVANASTIALIVAYGDTIVGGLLIIGLFTRIASLAGLLVNLLILLAIVSRPYDERLIFGISELAFIIVGAGLSLGIDGALRKVYPKLSWL